ncbi:MAG: hypothetical protein MSC30_14550 [Gaiellaceae bacterium MAG52_C11]|nr:hypothetical protein [Candidatus Gaiellasilicea maunaloa]
MRIKARGFALSLVGLLGAFTLVVGAAGAVGEAVHSITDGVVDTPLEADAQHGGSDGHLPATSANVELVGKLRLSGVVPGRVSDVGTLGDYAYLGAYNTPCGEGGVYVVDISNPASPTEVGFIETAPGSYVSEGVQALSLETDAFEGDILVINNEICDDSGGTQIGGFSIFDVTNPRSPVPLVQGAGDTDPGGAFSAANQIHSAFAWQQGEHAFVVIVDDEELEDVDIFDITDPSSPVFVAQVSLADWPGAQDAQSAGIGSFDASFLHDMVVKKVNGHWLMLLSYWDAGFIVLNVDDPANPVFVEDTTFTDPDPETGTSPPEGNAHQAEWSNNNTFILGTDEDFTPYDIGDFLITTGPFAGEYAASIVPGAAAPSILPDLTLNGPVVYGGYGCPDSAPIPRPEDISGYLEMLEPGEEKTIVLQRGPTGDPSATEAACFPGEKAGQAVLAGWEAVVFVARHVVTALPEPIPPVCGSGGFTDEIVGVCTTHEAFHKLFNTPVSFTYPEAPAIGAIGERIEVTSVFDGWGYIHLYDAKTLAEIDTYAIPEALDPAFASGFGDLSVHEVATDPHSDLAYVSYYAGGFRVLRFGDNGIQEVGRFIDHGGNNFWGVQIADPKHKKKGNPLVLASDRDFGLYLFRYTGKK